MIVVKTVMREKKLHAAWRNAEETTKVDLYDTLQEAWSAIVDRHKGYLPLDKVQKSTLQDIIFGRQVTNLEEGGNWLDIYVRKYHISFYSAEQLSASEVQKKLQEQKSSILPFSPDDKPLFE